MSFPYNTGQGDASGFPPWDILQQHSPLGTPSSATFALDTPMDNPSPYQQQQQQQSEYTPAIDNAPILLHHPNENPQPQQRHRPKAQSGATGTPIIHPIDALIYSRPPSAASSIRAGVSPVHSIPMGMSQLIGRTHHYPPPPTDPQSAPSPVPTPVPSSSKQQTGPMRASTRTRAASSSHPYLRQGQGQGQGQGAHSPPGSTVMTRSKARKQGVKFADPPAVGASTLVGMSHQGHGGMVERPASSTSGSAAVQPTGTTFFGTSATPELSQEHYHTLTPEGPGVSPQPATQIQMPTIVEETVQQSSPRAAPQASTSTSSRSRTKIPSHRLTNLTVHTDMSYSSQTHTLSCSLELPGVHPSHLRVSLGTCYFNHVKYVGVVGESVPVFGNESVLIGGGLRGGERSVEEEREEEQAKRGLRAELVSGIRSGLRWRRADDDNTTGDDDHIKIGRIVNPNLRERRFGIFRRFIQVPSHTTSKDITATLKHGVLTLTIYCGAPFDQDDEEEVPVTFD